MGVFDVLKEKARRRFMPTRAEHAQDVKLELGNYREQSKLLGARNKVARLRLSSERIARQRDNLQFRAPARKRRGGFDPFSL